MVLLFIISAVAAVFNAVMDVMSFRWFLSIFPKLGRSPGKWGKFWSWWADMTSWSNKDEVSEKWDWLFRGVLVGFMDLWHFAQMVMFTTYQAGLVYLADLPPLLHPTPDFIIYLAMMKVIHGVVFELFWKRVLINPQFYEK